MLSLSTLTSFCHSPHLCFILWPLPPVDSQPRKARCPILFILFVASCPAHLTKGIAELIINVHSFLNPGEIHITLTKLKWTNSVAFSTLTCCTAPTFIRFPNVFITPKSNPTPTQQSRLILSSLTAPGNRQSVFFSTDLPILDISRDMWRFVPGFLSVSRMFWGLSTV